MRAKNKLLFGVGKNDADYEVYSFVKRNGRYAVAWRCPYYSIWTGIIARCYSERELARRPTYLGCSVCPEWLSFLSFKSWMETQDHAGKEVDKDILFIGNKIYSPDTCVFVSPDLNKFLTDAGAARGKWPLGVNWNSRDKKFQAACGNPFTGRKESAGYYSCPDQAHQAWRRYKHKIAMIYADMQDDERIAHALRIRFAPTTPESMGV